MSDQTGNQGSDRHLNQGMNSPSARPSAFSSSASSSSNGPNTTPIKFKLTPRNDLQSDKLGQEDPSPLLGKRGRLSLRDPTHHDDYDDDDDDVRRRSLTDYKNNDFDDDDEAEEEEYDTVNNGPGSGMKRIHPLSSRHSSSAPATSQMLPSAIDTDKEFLDLVVSFAQLDLPAGDDIPPESCPICLEQFPLATFAEHVYVCIRKLDAAERRHEEELGARAARALLLAETDVPPRSNPQRQSSFVRSFYDRGGSDDTGDGMGADAGSGDMGDMGDMDASQGEVALQRTETEKFDQALEEQRRLELEIKAKRKGKPECEAGQECMRQDAAHFLAYYHPSDSCPVCTAPVQRQFMVAHLSQCETASEATRETIREQLEMEHQERLDLQRQYHLSRQKAAAVAAAGGSSSMTRNNVHDVGMMMMGSNSPPHGMEGQAAGGFRRIGSGTTKLRGSFRIRDQGQDVLDDEDDDEGVGRPAAAPLNNDDDDDDDDEDDIDHNDIPNTPPLDGLDSASESKSALNLPRTLSDTATAGGRGMGSVNIALASAPRHAADDIELNVRQLGAMARLVLEQRRRQQQAEKEGTGVKGVVDASLHGLLRAFEGLGFTKERLQETLARKNEEKE